MALNTWAASILRFGTGILKWNKNELQEIDRKTRRFMTMNKELHPRNDVARLYVSRKNGGRGLIGCEFFFFFFFNCYLADPRPTLGHSQGDSLTNQMLITAF